MSKLPDFLKVGRERVGYKKVGVKRGKQTNKNQNENTNENKRLKLKMCLEELCEDPKIIPKHRNSLKFLSNRELGSTAGVQAEKEFYQMKTSHIEKSSSSNLSTHFSYDSCEVNFITGDDKSVYGVWCLRNDREEKNYVIGESYMNNENDAFQTHKSCNAILDMCRGPTDFLTVPSSLYLPYFHVFDFRLQVPVAYDPPYHCCCCVPSGYVGVLGADEFLLFFDIGTQLRRSESIRVPAKVCTVSSYGASGFIFSSGLHTGVLKIDDLRTTSVAYSIKISDKAVNDSVFVNDQELIVTDVEGKLVKVDLRTRKISDTFFGHKHSVTKRPFSVANNMLCATGSDNVVRIWHISGGHPIHVEKSISGHEVRGWLSSYGSKTYLNYFERDTRTVFTI